jgi:carotenoid cleavage dioxygenase
LLESAARNPRDSPYKLTANTDVLSWNGKLYCLWYISGTPYAVDLETLETFGEETFAHEGLRTTAHAKVCSETGELIFFDYGFRAPFMRCGVVGTDGVVSNLASIDLGGPRLPHDLAITRNHTILMDLPVLPDPEALKRGRWRTSFASEVPARFGVMPRHGRGSDIRWFEAAPCYVYHVINAWEDGNTIVMTGCRCPDPIQAPRERDGKLGQMMANLRVTASLHRWTFDLDTGECREEQLDDRNAEFPSVDLRTVGQANRHGFTMALDIDSTLRFSGIVKYDLHTASATEWSVGEGRFASEAPFAPRDGSESDDDGYLVSLVRDANSGGSELVILDAADLQQVCRLSVPFDVPNGFHATWADSDELAKARTASSSNLLTHRG